MGRNAKLKRKRKQQTRSAEDHIAQEMHRQVLKCIHARRGTPGVTVLCWVDHEHRVLWWTPDTLQSWLDTASEEARSLHYWGLRGKVMGILEHIDYQVESLMIYLHDDGKLPDIHLHDHNAIAKTLEEWNV